MALMSSAGDHFSAALAEARAATPAERERADLVTREDPGWERVSVIPGADVALVPVHGILAAGAPQWMEAYGFFNTQRIHKIAAELASDPTIAAVVIDFDTPGGMVLGTAEAADALVRLAAALKERAGILMGYSAGMCASGGYWLASACHGLASSPSALWGSIGVIRVGVDDSGAYAAEGLVDKTKVSKGAEKKLIGYPGHKWTAEDDAAVQSAVDEMGLHFRVAVQTNREPDMAEECFSGQYWQARSAPAGLIDSVSSATLELFIAAVIIEMGKHVTE